MELLEQILMWVGVSVSAATFIVLGLEKIAKVTPSTKDDLYVGKAKKYLGVAANLLERFSIHTPKDKK